MADGLRLALTTLTVLPVRGPKRLDRQTAGQAMALAPLIGLLLGLPLALLLAAADRLTDGTPLLPAALVVAVLALLTRGLHLDGLADLVDGLASYRTPECARAVMKSPEVGALGAASLVLVPLVQIAALVACTEAGRGPLAVVLALVTGRLAVTWACTRGVSAASPDGLGALVAGTVPVLVAAGLTALTAVAAGLAVRSGVAVLAILGGLLGARALQAHAVRRLGGITGDVLGALVETTTAVALVVLAVSP